MTTLDTILGLQPKEVQNNITVIGKDELTIPLLHIAIKPFAYLQPILSRSSMAKENRTLPRVHAAEDLLGCFIGYGYKRLVNDLTERDVNKSKLQFGKEIATYKGGFYIHELNFDYCLKPTKALVPDVEDSRERWLVTYDQSTVKYPAEIIGLIVLQSYQIETNTETKGGRDSSLTFLIKANKPIVLRDSLIIKEGYSRFTLKDNWEEENWVLEPITEQDFLKAKEKHANLLSYQTPLRSW